MQRKTLPVSEAATNRGKRPSTGSGEVKGSGAGAGSGGNPEDLDSDTAGGGEGIEPHSKSRGSR